ncbi:MAG: histidine kinase [Cellulosilyticum sp.]|nr:histidine kinase [Cellulosilyticum sp.]
MGKGHLIEKLKNLWLSITIKKKICFFASSVFMSIFLLILFGMWMINFFINDFQIILENNTKSSAFVEAIEIENQCFVSYIRTPSEERKKELDKACRKTSEAIANLPHDYATLGEVGYNKGWNIRNSYETYVQKREAILKMGEDYPDYIKELYQVYQIQGYLEDYARGFMTYTLETSNNAYKQKVAYLKHMPWMILILGLVIFVIIWGLAKLMNHALIVPIVKLVNASYKITENNFLVEDVTVQSKDEMGELVKAFNKMKYETREHIKDLEEKKQMVDLLHKRELEKLEIERRLENMNLELLKSQINPHFLFNTLNVIAGMANLEDASTTEKMTRALSALFRYNLKTPEPEVAIAKELQVVKDYMYIQGMRFGSRLQFEMDCRINAEAIKIPTYAFQPLVENAVIHGISKKEDGGKISIRIVEKYHAIWIFIRDTGVGMEKEALEQLRYDLQRGATAKRGIGLGNIYKRVHAIYPEGEVEIFSRKNVGTVVRLKIPQAEQEEKGCTVY